jgi:hypothetical protein
VLAPFTRLSEPVALMFPPGAWTDCKQHNNSTEEATMKKTLFRKTARRVTFLPLLYALAISTCNNALASTIVEFYGDADGFGFSPTAGLVNHVGSPADTNGNGVLGVGEFLPDLDHSGMTSPLSDDYFDHRDGDPLNTDVGLAANQPIDLNFLYSIPAGQAISWAELRIVVGDVAPSQPNHVVSIEGVSSGVSLTVMSPSTTDGRITETVVPIDSALFPDLADGQALISIFYDWSLADDIAIDYASLSMELVTVPVPAALYLFESGLAGFVWVGKRRR